MNNQIKTYQYDDGQFQRVQIVTCDDWKDLEFCYPTYSKEAFLHMVDLYRDFFVKAFPYLYGDLCISHGQDKYYLKGKNPFKKDVMEFQDIGFLSSTKAKVLVNSHFFTFGIGDVETKYDNYGTVIGLCVKDGKVLNPPLFNRDCLLVNKNNQVIIKKFNFNDLKLNVDGKIYQRNERSRTPLTNNYDVVVIGDEVVDCRKYGMTAIPSSGYVINTKQKVAIGTKITYSGLEDIVFGIQVGNPLIINNQKVDKFIQPYSNLFNPFTTNYPPSNYPKDFIKDRAPRIVLGQDKDNKPVVIWFEGRGKFTNQKGIDSCGASQKEMVDILSELEIKNAINLDGGGSAQIIYEGKRYLRISDRNKEDNSDLERPIPIGLMIK